MYCVVALVHILTVCTVAGLGLITGQLLSLTTSSSYGSGGGGGGGGGGGVQYKIYEAVKQ